MLAAVEEVVDPAQDVSVSRPGVRLLVSCRQHPRAHLTRRRIRTSPFATTLGAQVTASALIGITMTATVTLAAARSLVLVHPP